MHHSFSHINSIMEQHVKGFHQYAFSDALLFTYASDSFAHLLGVSPHALQNIPIESFLEYIHAEDRTSVLDTLNTQCTQLLSAQSGSCEAEIRYRLLGTNGLYVSVKEKLSFHYENDDSVIVYASLSDISEAVSECNELQHINDMVSCGFIRYSCDEHPKIHYMNQTMRSIMRFAEGDNKALNQYELFCANMFTMIPLDERERFANYLKFVRQSNRAVAGELSVMRADGTKARVFGWVMLVTREDGSSEFQSVCIDITEDFVMRQAEESKRYLKALSEVYDKIFEFDLTAFTVKLVSCDDSPQFSAYVGLSLKINEALDRWANTSIVDSDRNRVKTFFQSLFQKRIPLNEKPPKIDYRGLNSSGETADYTGIVIMLDDTKALYCCRCLNMQRSYGVALTEENRIKETMDFVSQFTDGITAFEVTPDKLVRPLYASKNVSGFFGYTEVQWAHLMESPQPLELFVSRSETKYEEFEKLFQQGEAQFRYKDRVTQTYKSIKAVCSRKSASADSSLFVMLYTSDSNATPVNAETPKVSIRSFGYFDVFVSGKPIIFRNKKAKELLALLVDRQGGYVSSEEAISFLWENESATPVTLARYRKVALRLKNTLEEYGISYIVESIDGNRRIIPERVQCDLFDYLSDQKANAQLFNGTYLTNYSWGETRLAQLMGKIFE